jgi:hypothetical protein
VVLSPAVHTIGCYLFSFSLHRSTGLTLFFSFQSMITVVGPGELWATRSVVQAQRQIHRAFLAPLSRIVEVARRTIA